MNNYLIAFISLLLLEVSFHYVRAQSQSLSPEGDARYYSTRYDNLDVETFFKSSRLLSNYIDCLLDKKPCPPEGKDLKRILPEALRTSCDQCTQVQKTKVLEIIKRLYFQYPDKYIALAERYDSTGKYTRQFENWIEQNSNFINDSEVTISNILTTRRRPVTKTTTTTARPTFSLKLKTTTTPPRSTTKTTKTTTRKTVSSTSSRRPLSTRQTTSTTTTTSSPLSPLSFLVTFPSSTPTKQTITFRPPTQTFTNSFSVRTNFPSTQRPNILLTTSRPTTTSTIATTTEKLIPTTSKTVPTTFITTSTTTERPITTSRRIVPTFITTFTTTTVRNSQEDQFVPETTRKVQSISTTTTRTIPLRTTTERITTALVRDRDFDPTQNIFVTLRNQPRPQEGIDVIDNFFIPGGK